MKKIISSLLLCSILFTVFAMPVAAGDDIPFPEQSVANERVVREENLQILDEFSPIEQEVQSYSDAATAVPENAANILSAFNIKIDSLQDASKVLEVKYERKVDKILFNDTSEMSFDANGDLVYVSNFSDPSEELIAQRQKSENSARSFTTMNKTTFSKSFSEHISKSVLTSEYRLVGERAMDSQYIQLVWQKDIGNGVLNPYQTVKAVIDTDRDTVASYIRLDMAPDISTVSINENEAIKTVKKFLESDRFIDLDDKEISKSVLTCLM